MKNSIIFLITGLALFLTGILFLIKRKKFYSSSKIINGKVINMEKGYSKGNTIYYPIIEYYNEQDNIMDTFKPINGSRKPKYKYGDIIELRYKNKGSKNEIHLNTFFDVWGGPIVFISFGVVAIILGLTALI